MAISVLFVCMGNICRSPLAEAALRQICEQSGTSMIIDSAGTHDWHAGQPPDDRAQAVAADNGAPIGHLRARAARTSDFRDFDHVIALDKDVLAYLKAMEPSDSAAQLYLFLDLIEGRAGEDVIDPYYEPDEAFVQTWADAIEGAKALVKKLS